MDTRRTKYILLLTTSNSVHSVAVECVIESVLTNYRNEKASIILRQQADHIKQTVSYIHTYHIVS
jgi:hypothetical protein